MASTKIRAIAMTHKKSISTPNKDNICAIIVTFHPDDTFLQCLSNISQQVSKIVIVDNGSNDSCIAQLNEVQSKKISVKFNHTNMGIAQALNLGIAQAAKLGFEWVVLFDQDSDIDPHFIDSLCNLYSAIPNNQNVAIIGPEFRNILKSNKKIKPSAEGANAWQEVERLITSGSLMPISIFEKLGKFREDLFVYYVDNEFCFRARQAGYRLIKSRAPLMNHTYGKPTKHKLLGQEKWVKNYSPNTCYYIMRNYTVFLRDSRQLPTFRWIFKSLLRCLQLARPIMLFEANKWNKVSSLIAGWLDGVNRRMGPRPKT